jgi:transposase-like protein
VISDDHERLKASVRRVFGTGWQRCRVHWIRNGLVYVGKTQQSVVATALRQRFLQPNRAQASVMLRHVADELGRNGQSSPSSSTTASPKCCPVSTSRSRTAANCTAPPAGTAQ